MPNLQQVGALLVGRGSSSRARGQLQMALQADVGFGRHLLRHLSLRGDCGELPGQSSADRLLEWLTVRGRALNSCVVLYFMM